MDGADTMMPFQLRRDTIVTWILIIAGVAVVLFGIAGYAYYRGYDRGTVTIVRTQTIAKVDTLIREIAPLKKSRAKARESFSSADSAYHAHPDSATAAVAIDSAEIAIAKSDTLIAKQDTLIRAKDKLLALGSPRPNRIVPYVATDYYVDSTSWAIRVGVDVRFRRLRIGPAVERRGRSTSLLVAGIWEFR